MERVNKSHLFLLTKCQGVVKVEDFQPISLSNCINLIIAKILTNRLPEVIDKLVEQFQSAFILGRQLVDGAVLTTEVNFAKVYDSVDYNFLWPSMRQRGFFVE